MTTPGFISWDEYTDPGPLINSHFSETFAQARERIAMEQEELQAAEEAEAAEDTDGT
jgi:hypothetical protein